MDEKQIGILNQIGINRAIAIVRDKNLHWPQQIRNREFTREDLLSYLRKSSPYPPFDGRVVTQAILQLQYRRQYGYVTYGRLFAHFHPNLDFDQYQTNRMNGASNFYCAVHSLPFASALVCNMQEGGPTPTAIQNMHRDAIDWGVAQARDPTQFHLDNVNQVQRWIPNWNNIPTW